MLRNTLFKYDPLCYRLVLVVLVVTIGVLTVHITFQFRLKFRELLATDNIICIKTISKLCLVINLNNTFLLFYIKIFILYALVSLEDILTGTIMYTIFVLSI